MTKIQKRTAGIGIAAAVAAFGFANPAHALLTITLSDGGSVFDGGPGDLNGTPGIPNNQIIYRDTSDPADYSLNLTASFSDPPGTGGIGILTLSSNLTRTGTAGLKTLNIVATQTGYNSPAPGVDTLKNITSESLTAPSAFNSTAVVTAKANATAAPTQNFFVASGNVLSVSGSNTTAGVPFTYAGSYTMSETAVIALGPNARSILNAQARVIPEPASLSMVGLASVGLLRRRRA